MAPCRRRRLLTIPLAALAAAAFLWSLPPLVPPPVSDSGESAEALAVAGSAVPPPRQVTRSLSELGVYARGAGRVLSDHALVLTRAPGTGAELLALLLRRLQARNGFRLVSLDLERLEPGKRALSQTQQIDCQGRRRADGKGVLLLCSHSQGNSVFQEELVAFVTETLRREALPVAFHGNAYFTNFSAFDRQSPAYINLLRDPIDKVISRFYYAGTASQTSSHSHRTLSYFQSCIEESWPECSFRADLTIPYFCGHDERCKELGNNDWALQRAKANIERYFPVVGVLEDLNATLSVLEKRIPLFFTDVRELYFRQLLGPHTNYNRKTSTGLKPSVRQELERRFAMEYSLYNWAKQRLRRQYREDSEKSPIPGEAGQDRIAQSLHGKSHYFKH